MSKQPRKTASLRSLMQFDLRYGVSLTTVILCKVLIGVKKKKKTKKKTRTPFYILLLVRGLQTTN